MEPSAGLLSSISLGFSSVARYIPLGTIVVPNAIREIYARRKFFSRLKKKGLVIILFSRSPEKKTLTSLAAWISDGARSGSWVHPSRGLLQAQYTNLLTPVPLASKPAGFSSPSAPCPASVKPSAM
jgi:hypothetical protein